ncbi:MAG: PdxA family protein, partial [Gammaproteobacteria bacterium]
AGVPPLDLPRVNNPAQVIDLTQVSDLAQISKLAQLGAGVALLDLDRADAVGAEVVFGRVDAACGAVSVAAIECAARACLAGTVAGMVTAPIHKEAIQAAGYVNDIGQQEILARVTGARATATVLMTPGLRVVHLSTHKSLADAVRHVTRDNVLARLRLTASSFARWGMPNARIAVAALNPHGGEGGLLGREEIDALAPAVADARADGIDASGPWPADSVFNRAIAGEFDVVLALYHDQGHIAIKVHDFHGSTTATLGLPFVRTSVDHGTAFDIAGRGVADARSMAAAIVAAEALLAGRVRDL